MENVSTEKLRHDLRAVMTDTEELLKATAAQTGERVEKVRARAEDTLRSARAQLLEAGYAVEERAVATARSVDGRVHENPWAAVGVAAGIGTLVGILIGRR